MSQTVKSRTEVGNRVHEPPGLSRLAARPTTPGTGPTDLEDRLDETRLGALSDAVSKLVGDYGRTPSRATSWVLDERCVVTALEDFMTPAEHRLVAQDKTEVVQDFRHRFGEAITDQYMRAAESALGRRVILHHSTVICASDICLEIFLLAGERRIHRPSAATALQGA